MYGQPRADGGAMRRLLLLLLLLGAIAWFVELRREGDERQRFPAPGLILTVDGRRLHLYCEGTLQADRPPVILEAGIGQSHLAWAAVQSELAEETRVCAYDRAGYGWSDPALGARTADALADELREVLRQAGLGGPYLLVGQGLGATIVQRYAQFYPERVAGLVFVDPLDTSALAVQPAPVRTLLVEAERLPTALARWVAPFGGMRWLVHAGLVGNTRALPVAVQSPARAVAYRSQTWRTALAERGALAESALAVYEGEPLPEVPVTVIMPAGARAFLYAPERTVVEADVGRSPLNVLRPELVTAAVQEMLGSGSGN